MPLALVICDQVPSATDVHLSDETFLCLLINNKKIVSKICVDMVKFAPNAYLILMGLVIIKYA